MMYLSHTNDKPGKNHDDELVLAVVLDDTILDNLRKIRETCSTLQFPYRPYFQFVFPVDNVRLLEVSEIDEVLIDRKTYQSWEIGGDDPLDYYRSIMHPYEPKEDFFRYTLKPDSVFLNYYHSNSFGFDATRGSTTYYGYGFDWKNYL